MNVTDKATTVEVVKLVLKPQKPISVTWHKPSSWQATGYATPCISYGFIYIDLTFSYLLKSYKTDDPAPKPHLDLFFQASQCVSDFYHNKQTPVASAVADLVTVDLCFLLRP